MIVRGCNLKCPDCIHYSHSLSGYVSVEKFIEWSEAWATRIRPRVFSITGGETILHPHLTDILWEAKRIWHPAELWLLTNGTLPHRITPALLEALKDCHVIISAKPYMEMLGKDYTDKVRESFGIYYDHGIPLYPRNAGMWKCFDDIATEPDNDPDEAFGNCLYRNCSFAIDEGKLWQCQHLFILNELKKRGKIDWQTLDGYQPLGCDCSDDAIRNVLEQKFSHEWCKFCPPAHTLLYKANSHLPPSPPEHLPGNRRAVSKIW